MISTARLVPISLETSAIQAVGVRVRRFHGWLAGRVSQRPVVTPAPENHSRRSERVIRPFGRVTQKEIESPSARSRTT